MPVFDYKCENCGKTFEEFVISYSTQDSEVKCPFCGEHRAKKMISAPLVGKSSSSNSIPNSRCSSTGFSCGCPSRQLSDKDNP